MNSPSKYLLILWVTIVNNNGISMCELDAEVKERNKYYNRFLKKAKEGLWGSNC